MFKSQPKPETEIPILFLPSVAEAMSLCYATYSVIFVISVGCRERGSSIHDKALLGHRMVGILYNICVIFAMSSSILWVAFYYTSFSDLWADGLKFHLYFMMPSLLLWDLWVTRYRIRPKQVFFNAGGFLIFYITLFAACIIVPTYFGWNNPVEADDVMPMPMTAEEIVNSSKIGIVRIARGEELSQEELKAKMDEMTKQLAMFGSSTATSKSFWEGLTGKKQFPYKKIVLQWNWEHETDPTRNTTLTNPNTNATKTYHLADIKSFNLTECKSSFPTESCDNLVSDFYSISFNGVKKPMILGILIIIGLFVVNIIVLKIIETVREIIYRIYAFWRNTLMCVWCIDCYKEHQEGKREHQRTEEWTGELNTGDSNDVMFNEIQRKARNVVDDESVRDSSEEQFHDDVHSQKPLLEVGPTTPKGKLDETLGILKKPTKSKKVAKPVAEPAEQSMEWSGRNDETLVQQSRISSLGPSPVESPVVSIDDMGRSSEFQDPLDDINYATDEPNYTENSIEPASPMTSQITITEQPPQQNTFNFHRNSQDQQQNGMSPYPMPIAQHQQPQQLHPQQQFLQPQQQLSPNLMQVPGTGGIAQRSPSMRNYAQKPVLVVDGAYTYQSSGTSPIELDFDLEEAKKQHFINQ